MFSLLPPIAWSENAILVVVEHCNGKFIIVLKFRNVLDFHWHVVRIEYQFRQMARVITCTASIMYHWEEGRSNTVEEKQVVVNLFDIQDIQ